MLPAPRILFLTTITGVALLAGGILWQYRLAQNLTKNKIGCGGDWNYWVKCPFGSSCQLIDKKVPLAGGFCQPWLRTFTTNLLQPTPTKQTPTEPAKKKTINVGSWSLYRSEAMHFAVRYPPSWEAAAEERKVEGGRTWFIRTGPQEDILINFRYGKYLGLDYPELLAQRQKEIAKDPQFELININLGGGRGKEFRFNPYAAKMITEPKNLLKREIYIPLGGDKIFTIFITAKEEYLKTKTHQQTLERILSTIVFLESN